MIVHQTPRNYFEDQYEILSEEQRRLPKIYLEHNTPKVHPTDTRHPVDEPGVLLVHVTHFNRLMWNSGRCPTKVIEHAALPQPGIRYTGELDKGIVVVNGLRRRDRVAGYDIYERVREQVALDLAGMESTAIGGLGDFPHRELLELEAGYRFFFNPIRYTSLPLAAIEAMTLGMPMVALATTEWPAVVVDGFNGYVSNDVAVLIDRMRHLLRDKQEACRLGQNAKKVAEDRFHIDRFIRDWDEAFHEVAS